jgi:hypothetical protein
MYVCVHAKTCGNMRESMYLYIWDLFLYTAVAGTGVVTKTPKREIINCTVQIHIERNTAYSSNDASNGKGQHHA